MRARGCLIALAAFAGLVLLCCVLAWFVGIPRLRDHITDELSDALSTEVANQIPAGPSGLEAGTYTISVAELQAQIAGDLDSSNADDFEISVDPNGMTIGFTSGTQEFGYSGVPVARDGQLVMENMEVDNDFLGWVLPADRLGETIEDGVNQYFEANGLAIQEIELGQDEIIITAVEAGA
jgi:hypothetical protein